ncbi:MAG: hypothetical protein JRM83_07395, partial [Nitrososphaerota archaeon]|nr:hypothetical protein [Nitrososphaerota archaeon]
VKALTLHFEFTGVHALLARYKEYRQARASLARIRDKIRQIDSELALQDANVTPNLYVVLHPPGIPVTIQ